MKPFAGALVPLLGLAGTAAWITAIVSVFRVGRFPLLDMVIPPIGMIHGVLIWCGVLNPF